MARLSISRPAPFLMAALLLVGACSDGATRAIAPSEASEEVLPTIAARTAANPGGVLPSYSIGAMGNGSNLRLISGGYSQPCSINVGIAFDGTNLLVSCYSHNVLDKLDPQTGALVGTLTLSGGSSWGAMAWDASRNQIWICSNFVDVMLVDPATGVATYQFRTRGCFDGLAYDGIDNSLWVSHDVATLVEHFAVDGTLLGSHSTSGKMPYGNSGIAVGGDLLYLANNGGQEIYEFAKDFSAASRFAAFPGRLEDLECDDLTFRAQGQGAIWSIDAYDRQINAWEIAPGACTFGGGNNAIAVEIDIKPGSDPNSIKLNDKGDGRIAVAVLTTDDFNAADVDAATVTLGDGSATDAAVALRNNGTRMASLEDVTADGRADLVLHFERATLIGNGDLTPTTTELILNGSTKEGKAITGKDAVRVIQ